MNWLLIIYVVGSGVQVTEFRSKDLCWYAAETVMNLDRSNVRATCIQRY